MSRPRKWATPQTSISCDPEFLEWARLIRHAFGWPNREIMNRLARAAFKQKADEARKILTKKR